MNKAYNKLDNDKCYRKKTKERKILDYTREYVGTLNSAIRESITENDA